MIDFLHYSKAALWRSRKENLALVVGVLLILPLVYSVGLTGQPVLSSYIADGFFYGSYVYDLTMVRVVSFSIAAGVSLFWSSAAWVGFLDSARASFNLMLPATSSTKFVYTSVLHLVVVPSIMIGLWALNNWAWSAALGTDQIKMSGNEVLQIGTLFMCLNTIFLFIGAVFKRYQWAYCVALLRVGATIFHLALADQVSVRGQVEWDTLPLDQALVFQVAIAIIMVILSWRRFSRIELRG
ncbi:MAG: hypothetical protein RR689_04225 [Mucinivorans sp.]